MEIHPYRRQPFSEVGRGKFFKSFRKSLPPLRGNNTSDTPVTRLAVAALVWGVLKREFQIRSAEPGQKTVSQHNGFPRKQRNIL